MLGKCNQSISCTINIFKFLFAFMNRGQGIVVEENGIVLGFVEKAFFVHVIDVEVVH